MESKIEQFIKVVEEMRVLQRAYFKDKQYNILALSKAKEKEVDKLLLELKAPTKQGDIFNY